MSTIAAIMRYLSLAKAAVQKDEDGMPVIFTVIIVVVALIATVLVIAIFIVISPFLLLFGYITALEGGDYPEYFTEMKDTFAYLAYEYQTDRWGATGCPTYNNKIKDEREYIVTFYGSSLIWDRYAYAISEGVIVEKTEDTVLIRHTEPTQYDEEKNPYPYFYAYYSGLDENDELWKLYQVGDSLQKGQRFGKISLTSLSFRLLNPEKQELSPYVFNMEGMDVAPDIIYPIEESGG